MIDFDALEDIETRHESDRDPNSTCCLSDNDGCLVLSRSILDDPSMAGFVETQHDPKADTNPTCCLNDNDGDPVVHQSTAANPSVANFTSAAEYSKVTDAEIADPTVDHFIMTGAESSKVADAEKAPSTFHVQFSMLGTGVVSQLDLHKEVTAVEVKKKLQMHLQIPLVEQRLLLGVTVWEDDCSLGDVDKAIAIGSDEPVHVMVLRVPLVQSVALCGSRDGALVLWDTESGSRLRELNGHNGSIHCVALDWASQRAVTGGHDKSLRTWDLAQGKVVQELNGHSEAVSCLAVAWAHSYTVSGSSDTTLRVWDLNKGACSKQLKGHGGPVTCVAISTVAWLAISGSEDRSLRIWDLSTGEAIQECHGHVSPVQCVACDPDMIHAASGGWGTLKLWHLQASEISEELNGTHYGSVEGFNWISLTGHSQPVTCVSVDWSRPCCLTGSSDSTLCLWKTDRRTTSGLRERPLRLTKHTLPVTCLAVDWSSMHAVSGGGDCLIVWDLKEGKPLRSLRGTAERDDVLCVALGRA